MNPRVRHLIAEVAAWREIDPEHIVGPRRRRTRAAVDARWDIIAALYDPTTAGSYGSVARHQWGASAIGRALGLDHTTVIHALRRRGLHPERRP